MKLLALVLGIGMIGWQGLSKTVQVGPTDGTVVLSQPVLDAIARDCKVMSTATLAETKSGPFRLECHAEPVKGK